MKRIFQRTPKIATRIIGNQSCGIPALYNRLMGTAKSKVNNPDKKLKSQGFLRECLLVSFVVTTYKPEQIVDIQAKT